MKLLKRKFTDYLLMILPATMLAFYSCHQTPPTAIEQVKLDVNDGRVLSQKYCKSCHQYPEPDLIDKNTWIKGVLPVMAKQLGLEDYMGQTYAVKTSSISLQEWNKIVTYYNTLAPAKLKFPHADNPKTDYGVFNLVKPKWQNNQHLALTTFVGFNPNNQNIYSADAESNLYKWNKFLKPEWSAKLPSPATNIIWDDKNSNNGIVTCIGTLPPSDIANGQIIQYNFNLKTLKANIVYADSLPRAVQTVAADFNRDGLTDYAVCGFGHDKGGLYLVKRINNKRFQTTAIRSIPGATQLVSGDFNHDGWPDLMCLFAQADEGIWLFLNDHKNGFITKNILHFPPIFGSSSFQLVDFNHDNLPDILYTAGDNSDYSRVLKPYHGVYIFINQGDFRFKKKYFYHIDGCTKAIAEDFKHSGKLDIAVISFFADFKNDPTEGLEYLEQTENLQFTPHKIPVSNQGRWITMNTCDYNQDGFIDLILGNFSMGGNLINQKDFKPDWNMHQPIIVLQNNAGMAKTKKEDQTN